VARTRRPGNEISDTSTLRRFLQQYPRRQWPDSKAGC
jgi:hypothetical protein